MIMSLEFQNSEGEQPYFGGAMIFFALAMASPYISGRMIGVKVGSPPVNQVRTYISSAICAGVVHHHECLAPRRIAIKGLRTEPLNDLGKHGTRPVACIDGIGSLH